MPSVPAAWGSRRAPRPHGTHGVPGGSAGLEVGAAAASRSSTAVVSAAVSVQTE